MANTALNSEDQKKEYFDSPEDLEAKVSQLASWILESKHFISFTGAGISTSAGIPDFRSGLKTILPTGPGCWELKANGLASSRPNIRGEMSKAIPSPTHMALLRLMEEGLMKYLISQNTDGLHRRSGIPSQKLAEVHGNTNLEKCLKCKKEYMRDFTVRTATDVHDHQTGRLCDDRNCKGTLVDSIINFGDSLDPVVLRNAFEHSEKADLCLAMGSSLTVRPAADMPKTVSDRGGRLVIVNLQKTPLDQYADLKIHAFCDTVIQMLMEKLNFGIPQFKLNRRLKVTKGVEIVDGNEYDCLRFLGVDLDGCPYSLFTSIVVAKGNSWAELKGSSMMYLDDEITGSYKLTLRFQGHYGESALNISLNTNNMHTVVYHMVFDPITKKWESVERLDTLCLKAPEKPKGKAVTLFIICVFIYYIITLLSYF
jgi:NAD-dependent SIR2 family protein deacetylase